MYPIADTLIRIKNAQMVKHERVSIPFSKARFAVVNILKGAGFISNVEKKKKKDRRGEHEYLELTLKYENGAGAISDFKIISRPSRHIYIKADKIKLVRSGYGIAVISTPKGIINSKEARKQNLGGEMLFEIW